jgi:hypothetical protein
MAINCNFNVHIGDKPEVITQDQLRAYADAIGLSNVAPGRYSWLFVLNVYLYEQINGVDPGMILQETRNLESGVHPGRGTKPATQFQKEPLKGLWHQHFFSAHFVVQNIVNELAGGRLRALVEEVLEPKKSPVITREMINELSHRATQEQLEKRDDDGRLTGEWIVFAKHDGQNYYLCLSTHTSGDQAIYDQIKSVCFLQFPFLDHKSAP